MSNLELLRSLRYAEELLDLQEEVIAIQRQLIHHKDRIIVLQRRLLNNRHKIFSKDNIVGFPTRPRRPRAKTAKL